MGEPALKEELTDLQVAMMELAYQSMKTDIAIKQLSKEMSQFKDEMSQFKDEMKQFKAESQADRKSMNKRWGELANKMGTIVEDIVAPGLKGVSREFFQVQDFDFFAVRLRKLNSEGTVRKEFDVVAETKDLVFIVETKATPRTEYISEFIRSIPELKSWFPIIGKKKLIPVFASLYLSEDNITFLTKNNIFAMATKDDSMTIYNPELLEFI
ncbi:MAG: hypothetical protein HQK61_12610 [Desulfamplus sp.]|nr:hypothetical protein [Desulfamplus sp.]